MPSAEWYAARRREKLEAHQNALPPEERIVNRTDWDDDLGKRVSVTTARARHDAKNKFLTLAVDPTVRICDTPEQALAYFTPNGPPFTTKVMRKFAEAVAISSRPLLVDGVLSARSCAHTLISLWTASKAAGNPIHRDVKEASLHYIYGQLVTKGLIHTTSRDRVTAIPEDLSTFTKRLFTPQFATTLTSTREVLLLALFVCLQVDCSSRVSELVIPSMTIKDTKEYKEKHPEKAFRWSSVEIFAFTHQGPGGPVTLRARLTFYGIKDVAHKGFRKKTIPLRLLPPSNVAEDPLFWLVNLGLIDGVFADISSWADIDQLKPSERGLIFRIKATCRENPVFRPTKYHASKGDDLVSKDQMTSHQILDRLHRLSQQCGLKNAMLPNVLRRSSAYLLSLSVTPEERKARMGHSENSATYWGAYRNTTSTVDFQALRHNIEQENVATMSSVFLNTDDPPPTCVSDEGMTEIFNKPELVAISTEQSELLDELLTQHGSLEAAQTQNPYRHGRYQTLRKKHAEKLTYLQVQRYKSEYKAWWAAKEGRPEQTGPQTPMAGSNGVDQLLDESQDQDDQVSESTMPIDPRLLEEEEAEASAAAASLTKGLDEVEENGNGTAEPLDAVQDAGGSKKKPRKFVKSGEDVPRHSLVDILPRLLYVRAKHLYWSDISAVCTTVFNHLHSPGRFYPNQEPLPGTFDCRFCGMPFIGDELPKGTSPEYHSYHCEAERRREAEYARATSQGSATVAIQRCPLGNCSYNLETTTPANFTFHVRSDKKHYSSDPEPHFVCKSHGVPIVFHSINDIRIHAIAAHSAPTGLLPRDFWQALLYFCPFCQVYVSRLDALEEDHLRGHVMSGDAAATITEHGISGYMRAGVWTHPGFCIFCAHDTRLSVMKRFRVLTSTDALLQHVAEHVMEITDGICCPAVASTPEGLPQCTEAATFEADEMGKHLEEKHGIRQVTCKKQKKAAKQEGSDGVQAGAKKRKTGRKPLGELHANVQ